MNFDDFSKPFKKKKKHITVEKVSSRSNLKLCEVILAIENSRALF